MQECLEINGLTGALFGAKLTNQILFDILSFCNSDNSKQIKSVLPQGWWTIPHASFLKKIEHLDDEAFVKHIAKTKEILISIIYRNFVYSRFVKYKQINCKALFAVDENSLRKMIEAITLGIITYQLYTDGVIFYEPKIISMCICIYICLLYTSPSPRD